MYDCMNNDYYLFGSFLFYYLYDIHIYIGNIYFQELRVVYIFNIININN